MLTCAAQCARRGGASTRTGAAQRVQRDQTTCTLLSQPSRASRCASDRGCRKDCRCVGTRNVRRVMRTSQS
eukprot:3382506-Pleurochrysis_carterae.AAC.1